MRHQRKDNKLNMQRDHRALLLRNMATSIILYEKVKTTIARARQVRPIVEDLITKAKTKDTRNAIRQIAKVIMDPNASKKLLEVLKERFKNRPGGYTRVIKLGFRSGDGAKLVSVQLLGHAESEATGALKKELPNKANPEA